jgi:hypothetical protein
VRELLNRLLKLPSPKQRSDIRHSRIAKYTNILIESEDVAYLYYSLCVWVLRAYLLISAIFLFAYVANMNIDLVFYKVIVPDTGQVPSLIRQYSNTMMLVLLGIVCPLFLIKFVWNVNPKKYDVLRHSAYYKKGVPRSSWKIILQCLYAITLITIIFYYVLETALWFPLGIKGNESFLVSLTAYVLCMGLGGLVYFYGTLAICGMTVVLIRYVGPHE